MIAHATPIIFPILDLVDVLNVVLADDYAVTKQWTEPNNLFVVTTTLLVRITNLHLCHPPVSGEAGLPTFGAHQLNDRF